MLRSKIKWVVAIVVVVILSLIWYGSKGSKEAIPVVVEEVSLRAITELIPANGKIKPVTEIKISPDVSGEIVELNFKEGDVIKKGDLILKIKQDLYISMRERAEASLNSIKAQLAQQLAQFEQIEQSYKRSQTLYKEMVISESEFESAHSQWEVAKAQIESARYNVASADAALKEAQENLTKTIIYSPMDGIISRMSVERGERVVGTSQMAGTEMMRIANFEEMEVLVDVNENDIVRINKGDTATIDIDAYPNLKFMGVVTQIANSAKNVGTNLDQVTNFEVRVFVLPQSYAQLAKENTTPLRPGMSASVAIQTKSKEGVVAIPLQSVTTRSDLLADSVKRSLGINESREHVFVVNKENIVEAREITTGIQDLHYIEVISGLQAGDQVVTAPFNAISKTLKNGKLIKREEREKIEKRFN